MIRSALSKVAGLLASAGLAVGLLLFVGIWSAVATFVAQGSPTNPEVVEWAASNAALEPVVRALGLHEAFSAPLFLAIILLLGASTAVCASRRSKVALQRSRVLRRAVRLDRDTLAEKPDLVVAVGAGQSDSQALSVASATLKGLGIKVRHRDGMITAVSSPWSVWGSAIFHWSLVVLIAVVLLGQMLRSEGRMAVVVGQTRADAPGSYATVKAGAWHDWSRIKRSIRVDSFEPNYRTKGVDRGAVPTVSVLDAEGGVIATRRVYPNSMLHRGSLSISAPECGLAAALTFIDAGGSETGRAVQLMDFSQKAADGTVPIAGLARKDASGKITMRLVATVLLDRSGEGFGEWIPQQPTARIRVVNADGTEQLNRVVRPGEAVALPAGGSVKLAGLGWFSWLSLVDDPTIPFIYAAMVAAVLGLSLTLLAGQRLLVASIVQGPEGARLVMNLRLWRNTPTSRAEIESELSRALGTEDKERLS